MKGICIEMLSIIPFRFLVVFFIFIVIFTLQAINNYDGETYTFLWFTISSNLLFYMGFRKNAIFFDTFLGVFLWLGFWLKTTVRVVFFDSQFSEGLAGFTIGADVFDETLFVSGLAFFTLSFASFIREKFIFIYSKNVKEENENALFLFYKDFRISILLFYILLFMSIAVSNFYFSIYQRGELAQTILPHWLSGIYKWLLLFGLASMAALILSCEFKLKKKTPLFVPFLTLIEACITNISLLSRGMILNVSALGYRMIHYFREKNIKLNKLFWIFISISFIILFLVSVFLVNHVRKNQVNVSNYVSTINVSESAKDIKILFLDRWVGIEGMIAVSKSEKTGWNLFNVAINEKYDESKTSFYDLNFINSPYLRTNKTLHHYISLPGFIAFFYYADSLIFLCSVLIVLSLFGALIEFVTYRLGGNNLILASLIAQVVAYRYCHFGYVPAQSYLLLGAVICNILIIYYFTKLLSLWYRK